MFVNHLNCFLSFLLRLISFFFSFSFRICTCYWFCRLCACSHVTGVTSSSTSITWFASAMCSYHATGGVTLNTRIDIKLCCRLWQGFTQNVVSAIHWGCMWMPTSLWTWWVGTLRIYIPWRGKSGISVARINFDINNRQLQSPLLHAQIHTCNLCIKIGLLCAHHICCHRYVRFVNW